MPTRFLELERAYRSNGHWQGASFAPLLERASEQWGDRTALVDGNSRLSFREVRARVENLAAGLAGLGVRRGSVVALQLPNWWETVIASWAVIRLGAVLTPVHPMYRRRELDFILRESEAEVLLVPGTFRKFDHRTLAGELRRALPRLRHVVVVRDPAAAGEISFAELGDRSDSRPARAPSSLPTPTVGSDVLLLMYTSGTTADPKGVLHSHDTLLYEARSLEHAHGLGPGDTVLMPSPLTHVSGLIHAVLLPFVLGTRAVLMDCWNTDQARELIELDSVTYMIGAPIFLSDLTHHPRLADQPTRSLRLFSCGGAGVSPELILESRRRLGCVAKRVYGSTEFPTLTTTGPNDPPELGAATEGKAIGAAEIRIVDEDGTVLPPGQEGEILARGPECFLGYQDPALDAEAFTPDGWFRTADLGTVDLQGFLTVTGRKKDIIIRKGEKISAAELETMIAGHPSVADVAVIAIPDPVTGERACACVLLRPGAKLTLEELCDFLRAEGLPNQKLPESLEIVTDFPRTASGKVQKHLLRRLGGK